MSALRAARYGAWAALVALALIVGGVLLAPRGGGGGSGAAAVGGPFDLPAADGTRVSAAGLKGRPFALFFGFTNCPDVCPTTMFDVASDLKALDAKGVRGAGDFRVLFVTVDPARDGAAALKAYAAAFDPRVVALVPDEVDLASLAKAYKATYRRVPTPSGYTMDHTAAVYLMDAAGRFAGTLDLNEAATDRRAKLERLLRG